MIRKGYRGTFGTALLLAIALIGAWSTNAAATPNANSVVFNLRVFNDCPTSVLTTFNGYPAQVSIDDAVLDCMGFANLHNWHFSEDGVNDAVFNNGDCFTFSATLVISGTANGESGLQLSPWWSQNVDGRLNVRVPDGEIACFGGRLPFFTFTGNFGITYVRGTPIFLEMAYDPNGLSQADPATMTYTVIYGGNTYTSGPLPFDEGNPNEDPPYGLWGMLNDGRAGAHFQPFLQPGNPNANLRATWSDISYTVCPPTSVESTTWGQVKGLFR